MLLEILRRAEDNYMNTGHVVFPSGLFTYDNRTLFEKQMDVMMGLLNFPKPVVSVSFPSYFPSQLLGLLFHPRKKKFPCMPLQGSRIPDST